MMGLVNALPPLPDTIVADFNRIRAGFAETVGLRFVAIDYEQIVAEVEVGPHLLQPYGLVHGGVYSMIVETLSSVGAALNLAAFGRHALGLENSTSFLRAVRTGTLVGRATPLSRKKRSQVWEAEVRCEGQLVASGRVRCLGLEGEAAIAGEVVAFPWRAESGGNVADEPA